MSINNVFKKYKNKHLGESAFLIGTGPTCADFENYYIGNKNKFKDIIKIGCNSMVYSPIVMDYFFIGDKNIGWNSSKSFLKNIEIYANYKSNISNFSRGFWEHAPYDFVKSKNNYKKYATDTYAVKRHNYFPKEISEEKLNRRGSIAIDMIQFALYAGFKNIYLVGHDCNYGIKDKNGKNISHYNQEVDIKSRDQKAIPKLLMMWNYIKQFKDKNYKDVNIKIINPVSLSIFEEINLKDVV
jgi:hypothetical protein